MKNKYFNILSVATFVTVIGYLMDGDPKEPSMLMRFIEFFMMTGILFVLFSIFYHSFVFVKNKLSN